MRYLLMFLCLFSFGSHAGTCKEVKNFKEFETPYFKTDAIKILALSKLKSGVDFDVYQLKSTLSNKNLSTIYIGNHPKKANQDLTKRPDIKSFEGRKILWWKKNVNELYSAEYKIKISDDGFPMYIHFMAKDLNSFDDAIVSEFVKCIRFDSK